MPGESVFRPKSNTAEHITTISMTGRSQNFHYPSLQGCSSVLLIIYCVCYLATFSTTVASLADNWLSLDHSYGHGLLLTAILLVIAYCQRNTVIRNSSGSPNGLIANLLLFGTSLGWSTALLLDIQIIQQLALPLILLLTVWALFGKGGAKPVLAPILLLYLAIPLWDFLIPGLQHVTAYVTGNIIALLGIPVLMEGNTVHIPVGSFEVAHGCSGLRYLTIGMTLTALHIYFNVRSQSAAAAIMALGIAGSIVANWIRVSAIILIGHSSEMQSPLVINHDTLGWVIFAGTMIILYLIANTVEKSPSPKREAPSFQPINKRAEPVNNHPGLQKPPAPRRAHILLTFSCAFSIPILVQLQPASHGEHYQLNWPSVPGYNASTIESAWIPTYAGGAYASRTYINSTAQITLHLQVYDDQHQGKELINQNNRLADGRRWEQVDSSTSQYFPEIISFAPIVTTIKNQYREQIRIWHWYRVGAHFSSSPIKAKLLQLLTITQKDKTASLVAISANCQKNCEETDDQLLAFLKAAKLSASDLITPFQPQ